MSLSTSPYLRAVQFLAHPINPIIQDECLQMRDCVEELDPSQPNAGTLSLHRRSKLERDIHVIFQTIQEKLSPSLPQTPQEILEKSFEDMRELARLRTTLSPKEFYTQFKEKLPENARNMIYQLIWMASGYPIQSEFGVRLLKKDHSILGQHFASLSAIQEGTIFEQAEAELRFLSMLNVAIQSQNDLEIKRLITPKIEFFQDQFHDKRQSRIQMKGLFNVMPQVVQDELRLRGFNPPFYGSHLQTDLYKTLGVHFNPVNGNTIFRLYAPQAREIKLILTAFHQIQHTISMHQGSDGIWTVETPHAPAGRSYYFMVTGKEGGAPVKKLDPFAFGNLIHSRKPLQGQPNRDLIDDDHESIVRHIDQDYLWTDHAWLEGRVHRHPAKDPMMIYEVHPLSWKLKASGESLNWRELAPELGKYCQENGYNAVELMAMFAHPQPISMGYQIISFFAPNCDMGTWEDFQFFVNYMHSVNLNNGAKGIHIIADWVPAHFALDEFGLSNFDGSAIFEDDHPMYAVHPTWGTKSFDFSKKFTQGFLASNADFLLSKLHIDGLRVDAVTSMLYINYDRGGDSSYIPRYNRKGSEVNLFAKGFLRDLNAYVHRNYPGVLTMAEESSAFPNVTRSAYERGEHEHKRGLGFDFTWHFGFMNDTLKYWKMPVYERLNTSESGLNAFDIFTHTMRNVDGNSDIRPRGNVVLMYSHDESANAKQTILGKMSGNTREEKFANGRMCLAYQSLRGGGPVLDFQGNETLQEDEWHWIVVQNMSRPLAHAEASFHRSDDFLHVGARLSKADLNHMILNNRGFSDQSHAGFDWFHTDASNGVLSFHRRAHGQQFACVFNTSDRDFPEYLISLPSSHHAWEMNRLAGIQEIYNSDHGRYGGQGRTNVHVEIVRESSDEPRYIKLRLPPLSVIVLEEHFTS